MQVNLLFQIAGVGVLTAVVSTILNRAGREELATLATVAGLSLALLLVLGMVGELFSTVRTLFQLT